MFSPGKLPRTAPLPKPEYPWIRCNEGCFHLHYFCSPVMKQGISSFNFQHFMKEDYIQTWSVLDTLITFQFSADPCLICMITFLLSSSTSNSKLHFNHFHELTDCNKGSPTCWFWYHAQAVISAVPENKAKVSGFFQMLTQWCYIWNAEWPSKLAPPTWECTAWHETRMEDYMSHWNGPSGFSALSAKDKACSF